MDVAPVGFEIGVHSGKGAWHRSASAGSKLPLRYHRVPTATTSAFPPCPRAVTTCGGMADGSGGGRGQDKTIIMLMALTLPFVAATLWSAPAPPADEKAEADARLDAVLRESGERRGSGIAFQDSGDGGGPGPGHDDGFRRRGVRQEARLDARGFQGRQGQFSTLLRLPRPDHSPMGRLQTARHFPPAQSSVPPRSRSISPTAS